MAAKQRRLKYPRIKKLTITIEAKERSDGADVSIGINGKVIGKIFQDGEDNWTQIKGAVHHLIQEIGLTRFGRDVMITSEP